MAIGYLNCYNHYKLLILTTILLLSINKSVAQTTENYSLLKKEYEGTWYNKESKHYISITFDTEVDYVTINDWIGKYNNKYTDAYKAYTKGDKLILYAENSDHHCTYCEMAIIKEKLIYQCNEALNFTDQFLNNTKGIHSTIYQRIK
jgi:hypothetical protein